MDRKELIGRMVDKGLTYQAIGDELGISKQRAHQILSGYKSKRGAEANRRQKENYRLRKGAEREVE